MRKVPYGRGRSPGFFGGDDWQLWLHYWRLALTQPRKLAAFAGASDRLLWLNGLAAGVVVGIARWVKGYGLMGALSALLAGLILAWVWYAAVPWLATRVPRLFGQARYAPSALLQPTQVALSGWLPLGALCLAVGGPVVAVYGLLAAGTSFLSVSRLRGQTLSVQLLSALAAFLTLDLVTFFLLGA
ncbi:MAG: hypothetical protein K6U87_10050 [Firmicutes bacterium]|nr:hypothetical protein [Bacillota bacterium]